MSIDRANTWALLGALAIVAVAFDSHAMELRPDIQAVLNRELLGAYSAIDEIPPDARRTTLESESTAICRDFLQRFLRKELSVPRQVVLASQNINEAVEMNSRLREKARLYREASLREAPPRTNARLFERTWGSSSPAGHIDPQKTTMLFEGFALPIGQPTLVIIELPAKHSPNPTSPDVNEIYWKRLDGNGLWTDRGAGVHVSQASRDSPRVFDYAGVARYSPSASDQEFAVPWMLFRKPIAGESAYSLEISAFPIGVTERDGNKSCSMTIRGK